MGNKVVLQKRKRKMNKKEKVDKISQEIYEYIKGWLNPDVTVPVFIYNGIRKIVDKIENPSKSPENFKKKK